MALMKWAKYSLVSNTYYSNETSTYNPIGTYELDRPFVQGYDNYGFSSSSGFYGTGNTGDHFSIAYEVYPTSVHSHTFGETGGKYYDHVIIIATCDEVTDYSKGSYIEEVTAEDGTYPNNDYQDGYWYVKIGAAFPTIKVNVGGQLKTIINGWVNINGVARKIIKVWCNVGGVLKEIK